MNNHVDSLFTDCRKFCGLFRPVQQQDTSLVTRIPEHPGLVQAGQPRTISNIDECLGDGRQAMPIGISLDDGHNPGIRGMFARNAQVMAQRRKVDAGMG